MKKEGKNIYPTFEEILSRKDKEKLLQQRGKVLWLFGLSGSGKTTIAKILEKELHKQGFLTKLLDGDNIRSGINKNLSFSEEDRTENGRRVAEVSKLFLDNGTICINCFVSPLRKNRAQAREIIGEDFIEVFIDTPLEVCEKRDTKGLYKKARSGEVENFTGISAPFEKPENPELVITTENSSPEKSARQILDYLLPKITFKAS
jgi:adenylylsulfate kinase